MSNNTVKFGETVYLMHKYVDWSRVSISIVPFSKLIHGDPIFSASYQFFMQQTALFLMALNPIKYIQSY